MQRTIAAVLLASVVLTSWLVMAQGQGAQHAAVLIPDSSIEKPGDVGHRAHTNHVIKLRPQSKGTAPAGETPASLACIYKTVSSQVSGCPVSSTTALSPSNSDFQPAASRTAASPR